MTIYYDKTHWKVESIALSFLLVFSVSYTLQGLVRLRPVILIS